MSEHRDPEITLRAKRDLMRFYESMGIPMNPEVALLKEKLAYVDKGAKIGSKAIVLVDFMDCHFKLPVSKDFIHRIPLDKIGSALTEFLDSETNQEPSSVKVAKEIVEELKRRNLGQKEFVQLFCSAFDKCNDFLRIHRTFSPREITPLTMNLSKNIEFTSENVVWEILSKASDTQK